MGRALLACSAVMALALTSGCETNQAGNAVKSVGESVADTAKGAVSLVNVNLSNVLNDLALDLNIDKANIPINAQIPITLAANVCGVSINILSVSTGGSPNCTAQSTSPELSQAVQQQMAANGSVGGGNQTGAAGAVGSTGTVTGGTTTTSSGSVQGGTTTQSVAGASGGATTGNTTSGGTTSGSTSGTGQPTTTTNAQ